MNRWHLELHCLEQTKIFHRYQLVKHNLRNTPECSRRKAKSRPLTKWCCLRPKVWLNEIIAHFEEQIEKSFDKSWVVVAKVRLKWRTYPEKWRFSTKKWVWRILEKSVSFLVHSFSHFSKSVWFQVWIHFWTPRAKWSHVETQLNFSLKSVDLTDTKIIESKKWPESSRNPNSCHIWTSIHNSGK